MKKSIIRILAGVVLVIVLFVAAVFLLSKTLGNNQFSALSAGKPMDYWQQQLYGHDVVASNAAFVVISNQIMPKLVDTMFHDTNDSQLRLSLIKTLNNLPGVQIYYYEADSRRAIAAEYLGDLGPAAKCVLPDLINALKGKDAAIRLPVITSIGKIRSEPGTVVPLLISYLDDDNLDVPAAKALAEFGSLAKPAVPKLLPLLNAKDDDDQAAARDALLKIDPEAAAKAGIKMPQSSHR